MMFVQRSKTTENKTGATFVCLFMFINKAEFVCICVYVPCAFENLVADFDVWVIKIFSNRLTTK